MSDNVINAWAGCTMQMLTESRPGIALLQPWEMEALVLAISDFAAVASVRVNFSLTARELGERHVAKQLAGVDLRRVL